MESESKINELLDLLDDLMIIREEIREEDEVQEIKELFPQMQALDDSIAKWKRVVFDKDTRDDCPLCEYNRLFDEEPCPTCVISKITGKEHCSSTPFYDTTIWLPGGDESADNEMLLALYEIRRAYLARGRNYADTI